MTPAALADVLPAVALALGVPPPVAPRADLGLPDASRAVVVLVDGLGDLLLQRRGGHAPFLRDLRRHPPSRELACGFPSTTASSIASLGTGLLPGGHGLLGSEILDPERDVVFSELAWDAEVDPRRWQPHPTVFEACIAAGVATARVGPAFFDGSGLSEAVQRGGRFLAAGSLADRVDATVRVVRESPRALAYLYWGELDKVGHVHGCESWQWGEELTAVDGELRRLVRELPAGTLVVVTADHGMVDIPLQDRLDLADEPELAAGVRLVGGEPRALHLYCEAGAAEAVVEVWRKRLAGEVDVLTRDGAVAAGWFGAVEARVLPRIGDVVTSAVGPTAVVDSRTTRPELLRLLGLHGARTDAETLVPLMVTVAG